MYRNSDDSDQTTLIRLRLSCLHCPIRILYSETGSSISLILRYDRITTYRATPSMYSIITGN